MASNGNFFVYVFNSDPMSKLYLFDNTVLKQSKKEEGVNSYQLYKEFDYINNANYVLRDDKWHLVVSCYKGCQIWNYNGSLLEEKIEAPESPEATPYAFTCSSRAISDKGTEYIA
eukprot:CAMPEP_0205832446 /NCGR_PEP_ID=MMETSP0206-20130828/46990_1 /ASSEMBLY_ACC=CAM_ASM_000279 /TAXON_ID=36767 /ORGANISM="Euplotes focardii, Strain TN1" /LENGTH=114 /DNA_ID=CAMNT_0053137993 /DNA_START=69 /DNA_END=409 /DNA_ORIENTATION=+